MLTKEIFQKMKEADLRTKVLIPLLQAMEYRDVYEYHGGPGEQGKDIVCWKPNEVGKRENLAFVVKATKMSGQAQVNKGTAGEVQTQIRQCFGESYTDPISGGEQQSVHHVWVVSNKKITKEAINAITSAVGKDMMRNVTFVGGDHLWELVETHLPLSIWHFVEEVQKHIQDVDSHYEPQVTISGKETAVTIIEKFPGAAEEKPIVIDTKFVFPTQQDAKDFEVKFQRSIEEGESFQIPTEFIGEMKLPEFITVLLGVKDLQIQALELLPIPPEHNIPVQIRFNCDDGDSFILNYVLLEITKPGTKTITFENREAGTPVHITLVLSYELKSANFNIRPRDTPLNAVQYFDLLKLITCLSKSIQVEIYSLEHGFTFFELKKTKSDILAPDPRFVELIDDLKTIQLKTKKTLIIPDRDFTHDELRLVAEIYQIVTTGRVEGQWNEFSLGMLPTPRDIENFTNNFGNDREGQFSLETEEIIELFNVKIPLGRVRHHFRTAKLKNIEAISPDNISLSSASSEIKLFFVPGNNPTFVKEYFEWLS